MTKFLSPPNSGSTHLFLIALSIALAIGLCSCGPENTSEYDYSATQRSPLVFGERQVRQARNHLYNAATYPLGSKSRQLDAILMMQSMPTGIVYSMNPEDEIDYDGPGSPTCSPRPLPSQGSGVLTSSTRLATAHHVVWPYQEPQFRVRFGGNGALDPSSQFAGSGGRFSADDPAESWDTQFPVFDRDAENFLFGNRLFQLGLDAWSASGMGTVETRELLREWEFVIDGREVVAPATPQNFEHQGFVDYSGLPSTLAGEDVAFLESLGVVERPEPGAFEAVHGEFPLSNPGMFFDALPARSIEAGNPEQINLETPLVALHAPLYPKADSLYYAPQISRDGVFTGTTTSATSFCRNGSVATFNKQNEIDTTLDIIAGSSGGAVLGCPTAGGEAIDDGRKSCQFAIDGAPVEDADHIAIPDVQGLVTGVDIPVGEIEEHSEWNDEPDDPGSYPYASNAVLWSERADGWTGRDRGNPKDPGNPVIQRHPNDTPPACTAAQPIEPVTECGDDADCGTGEFCDDNLCSECLSFSTPAQASYFGDPPVLQYAFEDILEETDDPKVFETGSYSFPDPTDPSTRRQEARCDSLMRRVARSAWDAPKCSADVDCDFLEVGGDNVECGNDGRCEMPPYLGEGVLVGLRGTATNWTERSEMAIGGIQPVCGPWTSTPWSQNWRFLMSIGATLPPGADSRGQGPGAGIMELWRKITVQYENRVDPFNNSQFIVWPHSMKLCPPNYFVSDVEIIPPSRTGGRVIGVSGLVCTAGSSNPQAGKSVTVPLASSDRAWQAGNNWFVWLGQMIGSPGGVVRQSDPVRVGGCDSDQAWSGIRTRHNEAGELIGIWPTCVPRP